MPDDERLVTLHAQIFGTDCAPQENVKSSQIILFLPPKIRSWQSKGNMVTHECTCRAMARNCPNPDPNKMAKKPNKKD